LYFVHLALPVIALFWLGNNSVLFFGLDTLETGQAYIYFDYILLLVHWTLPAIDWDCLVCLYLVFWNVFLDWMMVSDGLARLRNF